MLSTLNISMTVIRNNSAPVILSKYSRVEQIFNFVRVNVEMYLPRVAASAKYVCPENLYTFYLIRSVK